MTAGRRRGLALALALALGGAGLLTVSRNDPTADDVWWLRTGEFTALIGTGDTISGSNGGGALSVARASTKYCQDSDSINALSSNVACVETSGLSAEAAFTNLDLRNQEVDNATWTKEGITVSADAVNGPDGTTTAETLTVTTANTSHRFYQSVSFGAGNRYVIGAYAKAGTTSHLWSGFLEGSYYGVCASLPSTVSAINFADAPVITSIGNDWVRISAMRLTVGTAAHNIIHLKESADCGVTNFVGTDKTLHLWGAFAGIGRHAPSHVVTTSASATRPADVASFSTPSAVTATGQCLTAVITPMEPSALSNEWVSGVARVVFEAGTITNANSFSLYADTAGKLTWDVYGSDATLKRIQGASAMTDGAHTVLACNDAGSLTLKLDGSAHGSASGTGTGVLSSMPAAVYVGNNSGATKPLDAWMKDICISPNGTEGCQ